MRTVTDAPDKVDIAIENSTAPLTVPAGRLAPWEVDTLDAAPQQSWRDWTGLIGPGILLAGSSIGAGEWLFGPAVTAQFGGTFLWLATISILTQLFYNLEVMRYTLYCGEPIFAGLFRMPPGPRIWTGVYLTLSIAHIWPFMASNAAVPLAAAILGHLPGDGVLWTFGTYAFTESALVKTLGYSIFMLAFLPLIFGGKIYNIIERMMTLKLIIVLGFLVSVTGFLTSPRNVWEVVTGFVRFGDVAIRAETVIAGPHFSFTRHEGATTYTIAGTTAHDQVLVTAFTVRDAGSVRKFGVDAKIPADLAPVREQMLDQVRTLAVPGQFFVETPHAGQVFRITGTMDKQGEWTPAECTITDADGKATTVRPDELTGNDAAVVRQLVENQGFQRTGMFRYFREHGKLPPLDWPLLAAFAAIAGAGMLTNALFSNYARDKGWGMGAKTGAIPSAIGGNSITLSQVGKVFIVSNESLARWKGWFRHIFRDQVIWAMCSFIGLALPCMLSLEFIRNAPVADNQVAAMTAQGISERFPSYAGFWWSATLFVSFIVLAPNAVFAGDLISRLWTDIIWIGRGKSPDKPIRSVRSVYYTILAIYGVWGLAALTVLNPMQIAKMGAVLGNIGLGFSALHTLMVNRTLLPKPLRPNLIMQLGLILCGIFFLGITAITVMSLL